MITRVRFKNFKSLYDVGVDLERFTLIVGANGAGKSSILQGIHDLAQVVSTRDPGKVFAGSHHPARLASIGTDAVFELEEVVDGLQTFGLRASARPNLRFVVWETGPHGGGETDNIADMKAILDPLAAMGAGSAVHLRLDARTAATPHYSDDAEARVEHDGFGLPSALQRLQVLRDGRFEAIEMALAHVVPWVKRLRTVPHKVPTSKRTRIVVGETESWVDQSEERTGARIEADVSGRGWIAADLLSEGTVLTLALLTVLYDRAPRVLLFDDIDQALHPAAQGRLMDMLRSVLDSRPELQVVATAHSPFLVDHATIEEVRVTRLDERGATHCRPLAEHPKWAKRSGFMKPGEFWSGVGEDWIGG